MKKILRPGLACAILSTVFIMDVTRAGDLRLPETNQCSTAFQIQKSVTPRLGAVAHRLDIEMIKSLIFENPRALRDLLPTLEEDLIQTLQLERRSLLEKVGVVQSKDPQTRFYGLTTQQIENQLLQLRPQYQRNKTFTYKSGQEEKITVHNAKIQRVYELLDTLPSLLESINHAWKNSQSVEERDFYLIYIFKLYKKEGAQRFYEAAVKVDFSSLWKDYNQKFDEVAVKKALDATNKAYYRAKGSPEDVSLQAENVRLHKIYTDLYGKDKSRQWDIGYLLDNGYVEVEKLLTDFSYAESQNGSVNELEKYLASNQRSDFKAKEVGEKYITDYIADSVANQKNLELMVLKAERILRTQGEVRVLQQVLKLLQGHLNRHAKAQRFISDNAHAYKNTDKAIEYYSDVQSHFSRLNDLVIQSQEIKYKLSYSQLVNIPNTFIYSDAPLTPAEVNSLPDGWDVLPRIGTLSSDELENSKTEFKEGTTWDDVYVATSLLVDSFGKVQREIISLNNEVLLLQQKIQMNQEKANNLKPGESSEDIEAKYQMAEVSLKLKVTKYDEKVIYLSQLSLAMQDYLKEAEKFISKKLGNQEIVSLLKDGIQTFTGQAVAITKAVNLIEDQQKNIRDQKAKLILLKGQLFVIKQNQQGINKP